MSLSIINHIIRNSSTIESRLTAYHEAVAAVVRVPWDARERCSCTSDYWKTSFMHLQVRNKCTGTVGGTLQELLYIRPNDDICAK